MGNPPELYHQILNIPRETSLQEILAACKSLVKKWHPDKHPPSSKPEAEARFKAITESYEAFLDQQENRAVFGVCNDGWAGEKAGAVGGGVCMERTHSDDFGTRSAAKGWASA